MPGFVGCNCKCSPEPLPINNASYVPFHHLWCAWWDTNGRRTRSGRCRTWICRRHIWLAGNLVCCTRQMSSGHQVQGTPSLVELSWSGRSRALGYRKYRTQRRPNLQKIELNQLYSFKRRIRHHSALVYEIHVWASIFRVTLKNIFIPFPILEHIMDPSPQ